VRAMAYAQGTDIYVGPGQEKHLPHEAWHVVQQKQGRVQPTTQAKGLGINTDKNLENEASKMGEHANSLGASSQIARQPTQKKEMAQTAQLYTTIDIDETQRWEDEKEKFTGFIPETKLVDKGKKTEKYVSTYVTGSPKSSKLHCSANGDFAINADKESQHTDFFIDADSLITSNKQLQNAGCDFELEQTGNAMTLQNYPFNGVHRDLLQVRARHIKDKNTGTDAFARKLESRCDLFYKYIAKIHGEFISLYNTDQEEGEEQEIKNRNRIGLDKKLSQLSLSVGDVFKIYPDDQSPEREDGWNVHYGGIVATDNPDQMTLENYNRNPEIRDMLTDEIKKDFDSTAFELQTNVTNEVSKLKGELKNTGFFYFSDKNKLKQLIKLAQEDFQRICTLTSLPTVNEAATHYFKIYGPAIKKQSFVDVWGGKMQNLETEFSVAKAKEKEKSISNTNVLNDDSE
jgi:hypothetical protein